MAQRTRRRKFNPNECLLRIVSHLHDNSDSIPEASQYIMDVIEIHL